MVDLKVPCQNCNGTGRNLYPYRDDEGLILAHVEDCKKCDGIGSVPASTTGAKE